jgi:exodeoxyribonuclease-3
VKIASWNINSLRKRQDSLFAWLEATKPDIVCLQETKCPDELFPALALQAVGYRSAYHGEKSYNGVAILANSELGDVRESLCDEVVDPQARVIAATIRDVRVFSIYAPNGQAVGSPAYEYKLQWYRRLRHCVAKENISRRGMGFQPISHRQDADATEAVDLVVCGDFNVAPEDIDVHDPDLWRGAIMASESERAAFRDLCEIGLRDTLRIHHNEGELFSWWDYQMRAFEKNRGLRIDAVLASETLAKRCNASGIDIEMRTGKEPSDHAPVWAEFVE